LSLLRRQRAESSRHTRTMFITLVSWNPPWLRRHRRTGFVSLFLVRFFGRPVSVNPLVGAARAERHQHALACSNHTVPTLLSAYLSPTSQEARIGLGPCWVGQGRTTLVALLPCRRKGVVIVRRVRAVPSSMRGASSACARSQQLPPPLRKESSVLSIRFHCGRPPRDAERKGKGEHRRTATATQRPPDICHSRGCRLRSATQSTDALR